MRKHLTKRLVSCLLVLVMVFGMFPAAVSAAEASITDLRVNNLTQPLGIDTNPVFRWLPTMEGHGKSQSAYQIIVASTAEKAAAHEGDLWDSGKVVGKNNFDIAYEGAALQSRTPYYWAVQVWDETDTSIGWSEVTTFETGTLDASQWTAKWISGKQEDVVSLSFNLKGANWIWSRYGAAQDKVPAETMYFRGSFTVNAEKTVKQVLLGFTTDDYGTVYINGQAAGSVENIANGWQGGCAVDITALAKSGVNSVAADVTNGTAGYAGFIGKIAVYYTDDTVDTVVTDGSWKLTKAPADGWQNESFDASGWETPDQVLSYGAAPWNQNVSLQMEIESDETFSAPMLRKGFEITKEIKRARAYVSGLGLFEMKINGQFPDDTVLNPAHTQYEDTVNYRVFDVTAMLRQGRNAIAAEVGNSFYNCLINTWSWPDAVWRDYSKFMMELVIEYTDGTSETIVTDDTWKAYAKGPITFNDIYIGETYDARLEVPGWETAEFDDSAWDAALLMDAPAGKLTFENMEPMRRLKTFTPEVTDMGEGTFILRNPEMTTGWAKIAFDAPAGTEITITYCERLNSAGYLATTGLEGHVFQRDTYICKGEAGETYEPRFSYKGYEYIQVDGYPGTLKPEDVECYLIANDVNQISTFQTSSELVNTLHENMKRTMLNNMQGKPTDTPVWEKNGWTGDFNVSLRSFNYNFDTAAFTNKFQGDLRDSARNGVVPNISPTANWGMANTVVWNTAYINSLYEGWKSNGQFSQIENHYDTMRLQTQAYIRDLKNNGWVWNDGQLSDWVAPDGDASSSEGSGIAGTGYAYLALTRMAEIADVLGKTEDAAEYRDAMANVYTAFNNKFYNAEKGYYETKTWSDGGGKRTRYRQASNLVPLAFGLCPEEYRDSVVDSLLDHIINVKNIHLDTGMVGTQLLLPVLSQQGYDELAYALLTQTTYPSWGYWVEQGSTSTWEGYANSCRSRNHYFLGTYEEWLYAYLAGIRDMQNGYETVVIDPYITGELDYVNCEIDTIRGKLESSWSLNGKALTVDVTIPTGTTATIYLPSTEVYTNATEGLIDAEEIGGKTVLTVGSGTYQFTMEVELDVSKLALIQAVGAAKAMDPENYLNSAWDVLQDALTRAEAMVDSASATQSEVNAMTDELNAAIDAIELSRKGNLALGKAVEVSSSVDSGDWNRNRLTDGETVALNQWNQNTGWTSNDTLEANHEESVTLDLGRLYNFTQVELYPCGTALNAGTTIYGYPNALAIEVSADGQEWKTVYTETDIPCPVVQTDGVAPSYNYAFEKVTARYVRVVGKSLNALINDGGLYRMQLAEIEVYNSTSVKTALRKLVAEADALTKSDYSAPTWMVLENALTAARIVLNDDLAEQTAVDAATADLQAAMAQLMPASTVNLALKKPITVSSTLNQGVGTAWHELNLTDGDVKNANSHGQHGGWTSNNTITADHEEWAAVNLGGSYKVNRLVLYPAGYAPKAGVTIYGFPKNFVIEVSDDGQNWKTALIVENYAPIVVEAAGEAPAQVFTFPAVAAGHVRVRALNLHPLVNDGNSYRMQLSEIEVYADPETPPAAVSVSASIKDAPVNVQVQVNGEVVATALPAELELEVGDVITASVSLYNTMDYALGGWKANDAVVSEDGSLTYTVTGKTALTLDVQWIGLDSIATGKPVDAAAVNGTWAASYLTDGKLSHLGGTNGWSSGQLGTELTFDEVTAVIDLGSTQSFNRLHLYPRTQNHKGFVFNFPVDYTIYVSDNKTDWTPVHTVTDGEVPANVFTPSVVELAKPVSGRYVKLGVTQINRTELNNGDVVYVQLSELGIYSTVNAEQVAAAEVDALIEAIDKEDKATIDAARDAYNALNDEARALVTRLAELEAAELHWNTVNSPVSLILTGDESVSATDGEAVYTLSAEGMHNLASMIVNIAMPTEYLSEPVAAPAAGWMIVVQTWKDGVLQVVLANNTGANGNGDILTVTAKVLEKAGSAVVTVTEAELAAYLGEGETFVKTDLTAASVTTVVEYNIFDVNKDGTVNLLDLTRAQRHYDTDNKDADVNKDQTVNIDDLILILNNYTTIFA